MADDSEIGRLLELCSSKPPKMKLTSDERRNLASFVTKNKEFRKLKDMVRLTAWARSVHLLNGDPRGEDFSVEFARQQGFRDGMLHAIDLMEQFVTSEEDEEDGN